MSDLTVVGTTARTRRAARARRRRKVGDRLILYTLAAIAFVILAGPLLWMVASALKTRPEVLANPPGVIPEDPQWSNFSDVFELVPFGRYMFNSALVATVVTVVSLLFHSMAAYSLARLRYPGRNVIFVAILATLMVPFTVIVVPLFIIVDWLGLVDTYWGLILPMIPHAFGIFLLRQFYLSLPRELEEAAIVDGARWRGSTGASCCRSRARSSRRWGSSSSSTTGTTSSGRWSSRSRPTSGSCSWGSSSSPASAATSIT